VGSARTELHNNPEICSWEAVVGLSGGGSNQAGDSLDGSLQTCNTTWFTAIFAPCKHTCSSVCRTKVPGECKQAHVKILEMPPQRSVREPAHPVVMNGTCHISCVTCTLSASTHVHSGHGYLPWVMPWEETGRIVAPLLLVHHQGTKRSDLTGLGCVGNHL